MTTGIIELAGKEGYKIGLCGQAPSDCPEFAKFFANAGSDLILIIPSSFIEAQRHMGASEAGEEGR